MSKIIKSSVIAAVTVAAAIASVQVPASANTWAAKCSDQAYAQKNFFRCLQLNGN